MGQIEFLRALVMAHIIHGIIKLLGKTQTIIPKLEFKSDCPHHYTSTHKKTECISGSNLLALTTNSVVVAHH
jgi:hypothetical protein